MDKALDTAFAAVFKFFSKGSQMVSSINENSKAFKSLLLMAGIWSEIRHGVLSRPMPIPMRPRINLTTAAYSRMVLFSSLHALMKEIKRTAMA